MRRSIIRIFLLSFSLAILAKCDQYEFPASPYPRVETLSIDDVTAEGVTFKAKIITLGEKEIIAHGFLWSINTQVSTSDSKVDLGPTSQTGTFESVVDYGLYSDTTYYVRAFVQTDTYFVYGKTVTFRSKGGKSPVIDELSPQEGTWGDTIVIKGSFFSAKNSNNIVRFGTKPSTVVASTSSAIHCIVPSNINTPTVPVSLSVLEKETNAPEDFKLTTPAIQSITPLTGTFDDVVTIAGKDFSSKKEILTVKFNEHAAEIVQASKTILKIKVPREAMEKVNEVSVSLGGQSAIAIDKFTILPPSVTNISKDKGRFGETIIIDGDNFNPMPAGNIVDFGGNMATVVASSKSQLSVIIPQGIYQGRANVFIVKVAEQTATSTLLTIQDAWIRKADTPVGQYSPTLFSIGPYGYLVDGKNTVRFDPVANTWTSVAQFGGDAKLYRQAFTAGTKAYVGLGNDNGNMQMDIWEYNPQTDKWKRMNDFPFAMSDARLIGVNDKGYAVSAFGDTYVLEFDPDADLWTFVQSDLNTNFVGYPHHTDALFTIGNKFFVYLTDDTTAPNPVYDYDVTNNTWTNHGPPQAFDEFRNTSAGAFALNGNGYVTTVTPFPNFTISLNKLDPANNTWKVIPGAPINIGNACMTVNGKAYFIGAWLNPGWEVWEFDPAYE